MCVRACTCMRAYIRACIQLLIADFDRMAANYKNQVRSDIKLMRGLQRRVRTTPVYAVDLPSCDLLATNSTRGSLQDIVCNSHRCQRLSMSLFHIFIYTIKLYIAIFIPNFNYNVYKNVSYLSESLKFGLITVQPIFTIRRFWYQKFGFHVCGTQCPM